MTLPNRFHHQPHNPKPGETVECDFTNAELANQEIDVLVRLDGQPHQTIPVQLDANGFGMFEFACPTGTAILLQTATSADHAIVIGL